MDTIKLSCYAYLFWATKNSFDLDGMVANFTSFADEVVIATIPIPGDDTYERLLAHQARLGEDRLKVILSNVPIDGNNRFDGDLKTVAMNGCTHPVRIIADADERFLPSQRLRWEDLARQLLANPRLDGWMIPVVDLYGNEQHIRSRENIGAKFRMHKSSVVRRGVPSFAEKGGGLIDTSRSDTTEPLRADGSLASFISPYSPHMMHPSTCRLLAGECYVLHYGFLSLERRAELGRTFWKQHWEARSGRAESVATSVAELAGEPVMKHGLPLA